MKQARLMRYFVVVFAGTAVLTTLFEMIKEGLFPSMTRWQSHFITIVFSSVLVTVAAMVIFVRTRLAALVYRMSSNAIMVTDRNNCIVDINPAFTEITGYSLDEVKGKNPKILQSGRQGREFYQKMWETLRDKDCWQGDVWNRRKNGEFYAQHAQIFVIRRPGGSIYRHVAQFSDITERKRRDEIVWKQANYDALTGLPNRRLFHDRLEQGIKKSLRARRVLALLFLDLDRFKEINDTLGHAKGDALLVAAAQRIRECVRESDTVARLGGDEFAIILPDMGSRAQLERVARDIIQSLGEPFELGDGDARSISASIGIAICPEDAQVPESLLKCADQAMYDAKGAGRNCFCYFVAQPFVFK